MDKERIAAIPFDIDHGVLAEFESHVAMLADELRRSGLSEAEAQRAAQLRFGNLESAKESYRDQRGLPNVESFLQDARFAVRSFSKRPGFTLPGVRDARNLVTINAAYTSRDGHGYSNSYHDFQYFRDHAGLFEGIFAHEFLENALSDGHSAEMTNGGIVSWTYFDVLGTPMMLGRAFRADEDEVLDRNPVIVLSHSLWQRRFGARPAYARIIGFRCTWRGSSTQPT